MDKSKRANDENHFGYEKLANTLMRAMFEPHTSMTLMHTPLIIMMND